MAIGDTAEAQILLVDDDPALLQVLGQMLVGNHMVVTSVRNGAEAKTLLERNKFDLILSDIRMPEMSGIELLRWVKAHLKTPMILMTGFSDALDIQEAASLGADGFLAKPFNFSEVLSTISGALSTTHGRKLHVFR